MMNNNFQENNYQTNMNNIQQPVYQQQEPTNQKPNKNNQKGLIIGIIIAVIAIIAVASIILVPKLFKDTDNNTNNNESNNNISNNENNKEITLEALMNAPESPEEDFDVIDYGDGDVILEQYLGNDEIVVIPESLGISKISSYVFGYKSPVKAVKLADSIKVLEPRVFATNEILEIFVAGKGLIEISEATFQSCAKLREVVLNEGLKTIYGLTFTSCSSLKKVEIPDTVTYIQAGTFYSTPDDLTVIGKSGSIAESAATEDNVNFQAK